MSEDVPAEPQRLSGWARGSRRRLIALIGLLILLPGLGFAIGRRAPTVSESVANATPPAPTPILVAVERRELVAEEVFRGLVSAPIRTITSNPQQAAVVTSQPSASDEAISNGATLAELNDRPILVLAGDLPLLADVAPGHDGSHVAQLQEALTELGLFEGDRTGAFDAATQAGLVRLYEQAGYSAPPPVGTSEVDAAAAQVVQAELALESAEASLRAAQGSDPQRDVLRRTVEVAKDNLETTERALESAALRSGVPLLASEVVFLPALPAYIVGAPPARGTVVQPGSGVVDLVIQVPTVEVVVSGEDRASFPIGHEVALRLDDGTSYGSATITDISDERDDTGEQTGRTIITIEPADPVPRSSLGLSLQVVASSETSGGETLVVPMTALVAVSDGTYQTRVHRNSGDIEQLEAVPILAADGFVAIGADGLSEGDMVEVGRESP